MFAHVSSVSQWTILKSFLYSTLVVVFLVSLPAQATLEEDIQAFTAADADAALLVGLEAAFKPFECFDKDQGISPPVEQANWVAATRRNDLYKMAPSIISSCRKKLGQLRTKEATFKLALIVDQLEGSYRTLEVPSVPQQAAYFDAQRTKIVTYLKTAVEGISALQTEWVRIRDEKKQSISREVEFLLRVNPGYFPAALKSELDRLGIDMRAREREVEAYRATLAEVRSEIDTAREMRDSLKGTIETSREEQRSCSLQLASEKEELARVRQELGELNTTLASRVSSLVEKNQRELSAVQRSFEEEIERARREYEGKKEGVLQGFLESLRAFTGQMDERRLQAHDDFQKGLLALNAEQERFLAEKRSQFEAERLRIEGELNRRIAEGRLEVERLTAECARLSQCAQEEKRKARDAIRLALAEIEGESGNPLAWKTEFNGLGLLPADKAVPFQEALSSLLRESRGSLGHALGGIRFLSEMVFHVQVIGYTDAAVMKKPKVNLILSLTAKGTLRSRPLPYSERMRLEVSLSEDEGGLMKPKYLQPVTAFLHSATQNFVPQIENYLRDLPANLMSAASAAQGARQNGAGYPVLSERPPASAPPLENSETGDNDEPGAEGSGQ